MEWYSVVLIVFCLGAFVAWPVFTLLMRKKNNKEAAAAQKMQEPAEISARVKEKNCLSEKESGATVQYYQITFETKDGKLLKPEVAKEVYDALQIGETDVLLMQGDMFLDFGNRFGEKIEK